MTSAASSTAHDRTIDPSRAHVRIEPHQLYWRRIPAAELADARGPERGRRIGYLFEHAAPAPIEDLQLAHLTLAGGDVIACAMPRTQLDALRADTTLTLAPASIPDPIAGEADEPVDPARLNLLTGRFEPRAVQRRRRRWLAESAIGLALIAALLVAGLERRTSAARAGIAKAENEAAALYETALGPAARRAPNPDALLVGRLRTLERTRTDPEDEQIAAAPRAARVLAAWPDTPPARLESMAIDGAGARIVVLLAGNEAAAAFETHWRDQRGWRLQRLRLSARRDGVRLTARLVPQAPEDSPAHPDAAEPGS